MTPGPGPGQWMRGEHWMQPTRCGGSGKLCKHCGGPWVCPLISHFGFVACPGCADCASRAEREEPKG